MVDYLDATLRINGQSITSDLFMKPTDAHQYLLPSSDHPPHVHRHLQFGLGMRLRAILSDDTKLEHRFAELTDILKARGYSEHLILSQLTKVQSIPKSQILSSSRHHTKDNSNPIPLVCRWNSHLPPLDKLLRDRSRFQYFNQIHTCATPSNFPWLPTSAQGTCGTFWSLALVQILMARLKTDRVAHSCVRSPAAIHLISPLCAIQSRKRCEDSETSVYEVQGQRSVGVPLHFSIGETHQVRVLTQAHRNAWWEDDASRDSRWPERFCYHETLQERMPWRCMPQEQNNNTGTTAPSDRFRSWQKVMESAWNCLGTRGGHQQWAKNKAATRSYEVAANGKLYRWNRRQLLKTDESETMDFASELPAREKGQKQTGEEESAVPVEEMPVTRRSSQKSTPPVWMKDYVQ